MSYCNRCNDYWQDDGDRCPHCDGPASTPPHDEHDRAMERSANDWEVIRKSTYGGGAANPSLDDIVEELLPRHPVLGHIIPPPERVQKVRCLEWSDTNCK